MCDVHVDVCDVAVHVDVCDVAVHVDVCDVAVHVDVCGGCCCRGHGSAVIVLCVFCGGCVHCGVHM